MKNIFWCCMRDIIVKKIRKIQGTNNIKNWRSIFTEEELFDIQNTVRHLDVYKYGNFSEIRACYINMTSEQQYCPVCGKKCSYDRHAKNTYNIFCSRNCKLSKDGQIIEKQKANDTIKEKYGVENISQLEEIKEKKRKTCMKNHGVDYPTQSKEVMEKIKQSVNEKYGVDYVSQLEEVKEKRKKTCMENYGVEVPIQSDIIKEKIKATCMEKYGVEHIAQSEDMKEKKKKTCLEKYGVEYTTQLESTKEKAKETLFKNYGVLNPSQSSEIVEKAKETLFNNYGVLCTLQSPEISKKAKETLFNNYGVLHPAQSPEIQSKMLKTMRDNNWDTFLLKINQKKIEPMFNKDEYSKFMVGDTIFFKCLRCDNIFEYLIVRGNGIEIRDISCSKHKYRSLAETEIKDWILNINPTIIVEQNKRFYYDKNHFYECDIYLPEYNVGIEYHGLYWHCDLIKSEKYHKEKYLFFNAIGVDLVQIFENEWLHKQDVVKSILSAKLGFITNKIFARKCSIKEIDNQTYKEFCERNHIQGYGIAKVRLGLFHNNELVQLASFSKPRFNKNYDWENIRTCTKLNTTVVGGFSKLMKYFTNNYAGSIITYVDCRYFTGGGYLKNGFKFIKHTEPNYFYFKNSTINLESRNKYQKHKLKDILPIFDENMTEYENMLNNKYLRIFDAGNLILSLV